jgi:transposase
MEAIVERCAGIDIGQATVVVTVLVGAAHQRPRKTTRTFRTITRELLELREWLRAEQVTHVGMESTGIYWKPVYALLEDAFEMIVGNATRIKNVPGRKTDVKDSEWIADLVRHGLIAKSFVPPPPIRELRDLVRYRRKLVESRVAERNRLLKLLETANIKLSSVASNVFGVSGMRMLRALVAGDQTPEAMADLAKGMLKRKRGQLALALEGRMTPHHRQLLTLQLTRLQHVDEDVAQVDTYIETCLTPYAAACAKLTQIPGINRIAAAGIVAEIGVDMTVFHSDAHLTGWAGVCPGNNESAGKRGPAPVRKGNVHLKTLLVEVAQSAVRVKGTYFRDKFWRLQTRRGRNRAIMAIAHKILVRVYHVLAPDGEYRELGDTYLDGLDRRRVAHGLVQRLERMGYAVRLDQPAT